MNCPHAVIVRVCACCGSGMKKTLDIKWLQGNSTVFQRHCRLSLANNSNSGSYKANTEMIFGVHRSESLHLHNQPVMNLEKFISCIPTVLS